MLEGPGSSGNDGSVEAESRPVLRASVEDRFDMVDVALPSVLRILGRAWHNIVVRVVVLNMLPIVLFLVLDWLS